MPNRNSSGFTLIELMIVVAIVAILAAVALPAYTRYITKSRRAAAEACLSNYANYMERFYATNMSYAADTSGNAMTTATLTGLNLDCAKTTNTGQYYSYSFSATPTQPAYSLQAAPVGTQLANDTQCGTLSLDQMGSRGQSATTNTNTCWQH